MTLVDYERNGAIGTITLNRPDRLNAMTAEFLEDALAAFTAAAEDSDSRIVILTGSGRAFCAGGDLAEGPGGAVGGSGSTQQRTDRLRRFMQTAQLLHSMPKVTIAAINGACAGAGLSWACAADLRFASEKARFNAAFLGAGLSGDFGGTWLLPRLIGRAKAAEKYLLSEPFDAREALDIGLVSKVCAADELLPTVTAVAERLALSAPVALRYIKENLRDSASVSLDVALDLEAGRHTYCASTEDAAEATDAFLNKRTATFRGR